MLLNIYGKSIEISQVMNKFQAEKLEKYISYHENDHISINDIANKLNIKYDEAKNIINELIKSGIVEMNFKVYCDNEMDTNHGKVYTNIGDIPNEECDQCDKKCSILKNIIILYKVLGEVSK